MRSKANWLRCFPIPYFCVIASCRSDALGMQYVFPEGPEMAAAVGADFGEKHLKVFARYLNDFIVGHRAKRIQGFKGLREAL